MTCTVGSQPSGGGYVATCLLPQIGASYESKYLQTTRLGDPDFSDSDSRVAQGPVDAESHAGIRNAAGTKHCTTDRTPKSPGRFANRVAAAVCRGHASRPVVDRWHRRS